MINEPFEPISEPIVCGWPYHGFFATKQVGGSLQYSIISGGVEHSIPSDFVTNPVTARECSKVRHPEAPLIDMTAEEIAGELGEGREWREYAFVSGVDGLFYGRNLGPRSWIAVLDGKAWKVELVVDGTRWLMVLSRYRYGPIYLSWFSGIDHGYREFKVPLESVSVTSGAGEPTKFMVVDTNPSGTRVILKNDSAWFVVGSTPLSTGFGTIAIKTPTVEDLASIGETFNTASGELSLSFNPIVDNEINEYVETTASIEFETSSSGQRTMYFPDRLVRKGPMKEAEFWWDVRPVTTTVHPSGVHRSEGYTGEWPIWVDYYVYDVPQTAVVQRLSKKIKAHCREDNEPGFIEYEELVKYTVAREVTGQAVCVKAWGGSEGNVSQPVPDMVNCPPPSCTSTLRHTVMQTIIYAGKKYTGTATWSTPDYLLPGDAETSSIFVVGVLNDGGRWLMPPPYDSATPSGADYGLYSPLAKTVSLNDIRNVIFTAGANLAMPSDTAFPIQTPQIWNAQIGALGATNWTLSGSLAYIDGRFSSQVMFCPNSTPVYFSTDHPEKWFPAFANVPKGAYYKGKFIKAWAPSYADVWAYNPETYEILSLPRAPVYDADGYVHLCYV